ncbi:MAG: enoyl-CoA hydratase-related protein [Xanthomonadales bacterium]|jgi:methylglutaconyl-CoA hydratase|nr:enoyl-CoA hydratase-related protein [Xanthomonadales bacterium]
MLTSDLRDACLTLTMDRAEVHNAFNAEQIARLTEALQAADADPGVRAVVLAAKGASFSAGADLNWMREMAGYGEAENLADAGRLATLMRTLAFLQKPTIARVQGSAFGGGVGLVACCDLAIGVPAAKFALTEVRLGLVPAVISPYVIAAIGARQSRRYFQTAEAFDAARARELGLLHEVVEPEQLDAAVAKELKLLKAGGPQALAEAKALVARVEGRDLTAQQARDAETAALIARLRVSDEGQEGLGAFLAKRKPAWQAG